MQDANSSREVYFYDSFLDKPTRHTNKKLISDKIFFSCVSIASLSFKVHRSSTSVDFNGAYDCFFHCVDLDAKIVHYDWIVMTYKGRKGRDIQLVGGVLKWA